MPKNPLLATTRTVGTMVFHRQYGTCIVQEPSNRDDIGPLINVTLYPAERNGRISIPQQRVAETLRCVMTTEVAQEVFRIVGQNPKRRSIHQGHIRKTQYDLHSGDPIRIAEVLRDLYTLNECGYDRLQLITMAFELLIHELGHVLGKPASEIQTQLTDILKSVRLAEANT